MHDWQGSEPSHLDFFFLHGLHARHTRFLFCGGRAALTRERLRPSLPSSARAGEGELEDICAFTRQRLDNTNVTVVDRIVDNMREWLDRWAPKQDERRWWMRDDAYHGPTEWDQSPHFGDKVRELHWPVHEWNIPRLRYLLD